MGSVFSTRNLSSLRPHKSSDPASNYVLLGRQASGSSFHGELDSPGPESAVEADTDGLFLRKERNPRWRKRSYGRTTPCFSSMPSSVQAFVCGICPTTFNAENPPWWCSQPTVFGLRKDENTWEKCVVANEHLNSIYTPPPFWKRLLRRLRARARKIDCWHACHAQPHKDAFHYDPVSYALNFDDSSCCMYHSDHQLYCPHGPHAVPLVDPLHSCGDED